MNVMIGEKNTFDDWGLRLQSLTVGMPEAKVNQVDIPGADGVIDLTEALGTVRYGIRGLEMVFDIVAGPERWHGITSQIANYLHGQRLKVILDSDPNYYYIGRLSLDSQKSDYLMNHVYITGDMDPYKYELQSSLEDWLWDTLDFDNGLIREYKDIKVDGTLTFIIPGTRRETIPTFISDTAMQVGWKGKRYDIPVGESKIYDISLVEGDNVLVFYGSGMISIEYRGGIL